MTTLYEAEVAHFRNIKPHKAFRHKVAMWLVDLDELPRLSWWLRPFARFEARDHLGRPDRTIRANLEAWLAKQGVEADGKILMLANARILGHVFNPVSVFWCLDAQDTTTCVVAEVHNTYGERHCYLLTTDKQDKASTSKEFYVSPFQQPGGTYRMRLPRPGDRLSLTIRLKQDGAVPEIPLVATLRGTSVPVTPRTVLRAAFRWPASVLIRRHGIALWLRRAPIVRRPHHIAQDGVQ
ncbi:DUF1365 domain-containing protein [Actinocrispum sp. NPDC049592]|uniref:DUF1365 domain-containing protein n=1 Tax=Actinocrispum sp. NPDC049592 TaxID=3154835 RepID=UPI00343B956D